MSGRRTWLILMAVLLTLAVPTLIGYRVAPAFQPLPQPTPSTEVEALQLQLDEMRQANSNIVATVWAALGFAGGIVLLVLGFNFVQSRYYDPQQRKLATDEIRTELEKYIADETNRIVKSQQSDADNLKREMIARIERLDQSRKKWQDSQQSETDRKLNSFDLRMEKWFDLYQRTLDNQFNHLQWQFRNIQWRILQESVRESIAKESGLGVTQAHELLSLAIEMDADRTFDYLTSSAIELLMASLTPDAFILESEISRINETLMKLPEKHQIGADTIRDRLRNMTRATERVPRRPTIPKPTAADGASEDS